jgi:TRAP-type C4-dicarboxylate transport system substrate-binding protein
MQQSLKAKKCWQKLIETQKTRIKEELQEFTQKLKEELVNTATAAGDKMLQALLEAVKEKQKQRSKLWFWTK